MSVEFAMQAATILAVIGLGVWQDRRISRLFRGIGDRLVVIDARLAALEVKPNGSDPHARLFDSGPMRRTAN